MKILVEVDYKGCEIFPCKNINILAEFCPFMWAIAIYAMSGGRCDFWALLVIILDFAGGERMPLVPLGWYLKNFLKF